MLLAIGDPHVKIKQLADFYILFDEIVELIASRQVSHVIILGDILHNNTRIDLQCLYAATDFIMRIAELCPVAVLMGNHDMINNSQICDPTSAFHALTKVANVTVVTSPIVWCQHYLCVPYLPTGLFKEHVQPLLDSNLDIKLIFAHQEFRGSRDGKFVSQVGDVWTKDDGPLVVSGHIHEDQKLANVYYTGSLDKGVLCKVELVSSVSGVSNTNDSHEGVDNTILIPKLSKIRLKTILHKKVKYVTVEQLTKLDKVDSNVRVIVNCHDVPTVEESYDFQRLLEAGVEISTRKLPSVINLDGITATVDESSNNDKKQQQHKPEAFE